MGYCGLTKNAKKLMMITAALQGAAFAVLCCVLSIKFCPLPYKYVLCGAAAALAAAWFFIMPPLRFRRYKYLISPDRIEIVEGVLWVSRKIVPINRVYQINVSKGPLDAATRVAKVTVITAGSSATLRFLDEVRAQQIALNLNAAVGEKAGGGGNV